MSEVLVLGGTAWIGREVAAQAVAAGHRVTCLARGTAAAPDGVELVKGDRTAADGYRGLDGRTFDVVIDLARQPEQVASALTALAGSFGHWVFVSTGSVYVGGANQAGDESDPVFEPIFRAPHTEEATRYDGGEQQDREVALYGPGKVACEQLVGELRERATIARLGLVGGPGDPSDRMGYWPAAFARAADRGQLPVLVPATPDLPTETIDLRDVASFLLTAGTRRIAGTFDVVGEPTTLGAVLEVSRELAGHTGEVIAVEPSWLLEHEVRYWMGPRSLPLWAPAEAFGDIRRTGAAAVAAGLVRRPVRQTLADTLTTERAAGLDRPRRSGLTAAEEADLLQVARQRR